MLNKLIKKRLSDAILDLRKRTAKRDYKEKFLKKCFNHSYAGRIRYYFSKWKNINDRINLVNSINEEGDVVVEREEVKRNVKALKDFLNS